MGVLFLLWMCYSAVYDALYRRCENWVIIIGILLALASVSIFNDVHPVPISLGDSLLGFFAAFIVLLFFYFLYLYQLLHFQKILKHSLQQSLLQLELKRIVLIYQSLLMLSIKKRLKMQKLVQISPRSHREFLVL